MLDILDSYVPPPVVRRFSVNLNMLTKPSSRHFSALALYVDISGLLPFAQRREIHQTVAEWYERNRLFEISRYYREYLAQALEAIEAFSVSCSLHRTREELERT